MLLTACGARVGEAGNENLSENVAAHEFIGVIEEIGSEPWLVSSLRIQIRENTEMQGQFAVADTVRIEMTAENEELVALRVWPTSQVGNENTNENGNSNVNQNTNLNSNTNANTGSNSNANLNSNTSGNSNNNLNSNSNSNDNDDKGGSNSNSGSGKSDNNDDD